MRTGPQEELSGTRRVVTAVFADVVGSTALMEAIDPEDWTVIVNGAFKLMTEAINRYEGTIAQLQGDALVAFFGAPLAHEDDAERGVRAALDMVGDIRGYGRQLKASDGIDFQIRVGVNTGPVVVSNVGADLHHEYTAMGDAMNVAARMEAAARPGTVFITHDTYRLVSHHFEVIPLGAINLKGKADPVQAYEAVGPRDLPEPQRGIAGLRSPMVGRDDELAGLKAAFKTLDAGRGSVACLIAEPGVGKTRLIAEFKRWALAAQSGTKWVEGKSISYGRSFPYHLALDVIRSCLGVSAASNEQETTRALASTLSALSDDDAVVAEPLLAHLMTLPISSEDAEVIDKIEPEVLQIRYTSALKQLLNAMTAAGPVVTVLEDVHWADPASVQLLGRLLALGAPLRTMVCISSRPDEQAPGWRLVSLAREIFTGSLTEIHLDPLSGEDSSRMMASLLEIEALPLQVRDKILAKAQGNPFFIEELTRALIERGLIVRRGAKWVAGDKVVDVEIPETLRGLLLSRIDRLAPNEQNALKVASVIGRQFSAGVLDAVLGNSAGTDLGTLQASGLISPVAAGVDPQHAFRHWLVQDVTYQSLLKRQRRSLHLKVGEAVERLYPHRRREWAAELALHFEQAGDEKALGYLMTAAAAAQSRFAIHEARSLYERALAMLAGRKDAESARLRVEATVGAVEAGWTFSAPEMDIASLQDVADLAESIGDDRLLVRLYSWLSMLLQYQGNKYGVSAGLTRAINRANEIGEKLDDPSLLARPLSELGWAVAQAGELRRGISIVEQAVPLLEKAGKQVDLGLALDELAFVYSQLGDFKAADRWGARAKKLADSGDPIAKLDYLSIKGGIEMFRNNLDEAMEAARICSAKADEMGILSCSIGSHLTMGMVNMIRGRPDLALPFLERGGELSHVSLKFWEPLIAGARATAEAMLGRMDKAIPRWQAALDRAREIGDKFVEASVLHMRAGVAARSPDANWDRVLAELKQAVDLFEQMEGKPFMARALRDYGMALQKAGRLPEAGEAFDRARRLFEEMDLMPEAETVRSLMSEPA